MRSTAKNSILFSTLFIFALQVGLVGSALAYGWGDNWAFNWCLKCGAKFKHVGVDISAQAGQSVTFTDTMYFVKKGNDSTWKEWLVARNASNTYTYVVWHLSGIPSFRNGDNLKGKFIGKVANLGTVSSPHIHIGYRNAPYSDFLSMKGALPNCSHNSYAKPVGGTLPQFSEKFDIPYSKISITSSGSPGPIAVTPATGSWTSSPQNLNVSSAGATTIYYTMVNTYDGNTPSEPSEPSANNNNGQLAGGSSTFQFYASSGQFKRSKIRFRGYNNSGYGLASDSYSYSLDLRGPSGPDFVVSALWLREGTPIKSGTRVHPYCTVKNIGTSGSPSGIRLAYYINADNYRDDDGVDAGQLCSGCEQTENVGNDNIKLGDRGTRTYRCCVDYQGQVTELNEGNNCSAISFTVY